VSDSRTLGELAWLDIDNLQYLVKYGKEVEFNDFNEYMQYLEGFIAFNLERAGDKRLAKQYLSRHTNADVAALDKSLQKHKIRVEGRKRDGDDTWRSGHYVYKDGEIIAFIQLPREAPKRIYTLGPNPVKAIVMQRNNLCTFLPNQTTN
jgi:hypothetical protein